MTEQEIANSKLPILKLAELYKISRNQVIRIKNDAGTSVGRGKGERTTGFKLTKAQRIEIGNSKLPRKDLAIIYNVSYNCIVKTKRKYDPDPKRSHNRKKTEFTEEQLALIKDLSWSSLKLQPIIGISAGVIRRKRVELGLNFKRTKKEKPNPRIKKQLPIVVIKKVKPETEPIVKKVKKDSFISGSKTTFELQKERREDALKVVQKAILSDAEKVAAGTHEWVKVFPRGKALKRIKTV